MITNILWLKKLKNSQSHFKNGIKEYIDTYANNDINIYNFPWKKDEISSITLIGCGTAYHSCLMAKYWFEELNFIRCERRYSIRV